MAKPIEPEARAALLESLSAGVTLSRSARAAGTTEANARALALEDDDLAEAIEAADARAGAARADAVAPSWADVAAASAKAQEEVKAAEQKPAPKPAGAVPPSDASPMERSGFWDRVREEARSLGGAGLFGYLLWVEKRCVDAGLHAMDPQWEQHFHDFYASRKFIDVGRFGVRAAKSDSTCRAITAEVLLLERRLEPGLVGVCPILSNNLREASDRFSTIKQILTACGLRDMSGSRGPTEADGFKTSGGGNAAMVINLFDSQGHEVEFRTSPARESGAVGFTAIAGFGDELDLWGKAEGANPAEKVIDLLVSRYTTQPEAKLHLMSATYEKDSYHAQMIANGDTPRQRVARLGEAGAAKDYDERTSLARRIGSSDPLLIGPQLDPESTDIPCWVSNPIATIDSCYIKADGDLKKMFSLYGGRYGINGGGGSAYTAEDIQAIAEMNRKLQGVARAPGELMSVQGAPAGDPRHPSYGRAIGRLSNRRVF